MIRFLDLQKINERSHRHMTNVSTAGISLRFVYPTAPHHQGDYVEWRELSLPITERIHREVMSLPISPVLTDDEVSQVVSVVNSYMGS